MNITADTVIAGLPAFRVRIMLNTPPRRPTWPLCAYGLYCTQRESAEVLDRLVDEGYMTLDQDAKVLRLYRRTPLGNQLAKATVPAPLSRDEAYDLLQRLTVFLGELSADSSLDVEAAELSVIGELLTGAQSIPHLEVAVRLRRKSAALLSRTPLPADIVNDKLPAQVEAFYDRLAGFHPSVCIRRAWR